MNRKKNYNGIYIPSDGVAAGQLTIAGKESLLKLVSKESWRKEVWEFKTKEFQEQHGFLDDGKKVSLLDCVQRGVALYSGVDSPQYELSLFPNFILVGENFISSQDAVIKSLHYNFENADCLIRGFPNFGVIHPEPEEFLKIIRNYCQLSYRDLEAIESETGKHPVLFYYNGARKIVECSVSIGLVAMTNCFQYTFGSSKDVSIDNKIAVRVEFAVAKTVSEAISSLFTLHRFFELCLGKRQRYLRIEAELSNAKPETDGGSAPLSEIFWSRSNEGVSEETEPISHHDVLLNLPEQKSEFAKVFSAWLDSASSMEDARNRFAKAFYSDYYGVDRIVGAANMFDILPDTHVPVKQELDGKTKKVAGKCRDLLKELPESSTRQSILSALGRIGKPSLRDKIYYRADIIIESYSSELPELHLPCSQAVICRNHYVHGSEAAFNYMEELNTFAFLTNTLEFVFAVSDLIELGWDYKSWCNKDPWHGHKFGSYMANYAENLQRLKTLLNPQSG